MKICQLCVYCNYALAILNLWPEIDNAISRHVAQKTQKKKYVRMTITVKILKVGHSKSNRICPKMKQFTIHDGQMTCDYTSFSTVF